VKCETIHFKTNVIFNKLLDFQRIFFFVLLKGARIVDFTDRNRYVMWTSSFCWFYESTYFNTTRKCV